MTLSAAGLSSTLIGISKDLEIIFIKNWKTEGRGKQRDGSLFDNTPIDN